MGIYVNSTVNNSQGSSTVQYVRLANMLNSAGLALLTEKKQTLQIIDANKIKINKIALLATLNAQLSYNWPRLPKKVYKNLQNAVDVTYEALVTYVSDDEGKKSYLYAQFFKNTNTFQTLMSLRDEMEKFYGTNIAELSEYRFELSFIVDALKKKESLACNIKAKDHFYRGELFKMLDETKFMVKLVDYGEQMLVEYDDIFRPIQKHMDLEGQAFKMKLRIDFNQNIKHVSCSKKINRSLIILEFNYLRKI